MSIPTTGFDPESARWVIATPETGRSVEVTLRFLPLGTGADDMYDIVDSAMSDLKDALETAFPSVNPIQFSHTVGASLTVASS